MTSFCESSADRMGSLLEQNPTSSEKFRNTPQLAVGKGIFRILQVYKIGNITRQLLFEEIFFTSIDHGFESM